MHDTDHLSFEFKNAHPTDLNVVMDLERSGFEDGIVETEDTFAQRIAAFPEGFLLAGAPAWGYLCGEVWDCLDDDRERFELGHDIGDYLAPEGMILYIASMTVAPAFRGTGRGSALFERGVGLLESRFPAVKRTVLIVNEHWGRALRIYRNQGFVETRRYSGFFRPIDGPVGDALLLERKVYRNIYTVH